MTRVTRLHVVTADETLAHPDFEAKAIAVLEAGGERLTLHLRGPRSPGRRLLDVVRALLTRAASAGARLAVNDRVDVALALGGVGVHLGARSLSPDDAVRILGPDVPVGVSCHSPEEARTAGAVAGVRYLFAGPVWPTESHPGEPGRGTEWLRSVVEVAGRTPVLAIGGVRPDRVAEATAVGAGGVAVLGGVWRAPDPATAVTGYIEALAERPDRRPETRTAEESS